MGYWIKRAVHNNSGSFAHKARMRGMTTRQYADYATRQNANVTAKTRRQANLAQTLMRLGKRR